MMEVFGPILQFLLPVLASVVALAAAALIKKYIGKVGVERSDKVDAMIDKYVGIGVESVEKVAENYLKANGTKLSSNSKKAKAVSVVLKELEQSGIKDVAKDLIGSRIEAYLAGKEGNGSGAA